MASSNSHILFLSLLPLLAIAAQARPCKTLFISYTISSFYPSDPTDRNPSELFVFAEFNQLESKPSRFLPSDLFRSSSLPFGETPEITRAHAVGFNSFRDRTVDILGAVVALLVGVACGAVTAAGMYLVWSLVTDSHGDVVDEEVDVGPNTDGYVKFPTVPVKEGYEGN